MLFTDRCFSQKWIDANIKKTTIRAKKNLQTVMKEASKTNAKFEDRMFELNATIEIKADPDKQHETRECC